MIIKVSDVEGASATIPVSNDHTDGSWLVTDIYEGELFLNLIDNILQTRTDAGIINLNASSSSDADRVVQDVRYDEGVEKGEPLRITGYNVGSGIITVAKADASVSAEMPSYGLAMANYSSGATGQMIAVGTLTDVNTSAFSEGDTVYVAVGGGLTNVKPIEPNLIQNVGFVARSNANNGSIEVIAIGRANDVPNLPVGHTFIGTATNPTTIDLTTALDSKVSGTGTTNYVSKWTGANTQGNSQIFDNGTNVGIGTTTPSEALDVVGKIALNDGGNSVFVGTNAGLNDDGSNNQNVGIGAYSLRSNTTGNLNSATGFGSLSNNISGSHNTANGCNSLLINTTGYHNTATGSESLRNNTTGIQNSANGFRSLLNNTTGNSNTATGRQSLTNNTTGNSNTANGLNSLLFNTTGANNTANGLNSGSLISDGTTANSVTQNSVYIGSDTKALANNQTNQIVIGYDATGIGSNSVVLGNDSITKTALKGNVGIGTITPTEALDVVGKIALNDGGNSVFVGTRAGENDDGTQNDNIGIGYQALLSNTTGYFNSSVGAYSLLNNTTGGNNTAIGRQSLTSNTTGGMNNANGYQSLRFNTTGILNSSNGAFSLKNNTTGSYNTANGQNAGSLISDGTTANSVTQNSVYIGSDTKALANNQTNQIVIGYDATGIGSNSVVLGNDSITKTALKGNVGIGTTSPTEKLEVNGNIKASGSVQVGDNTDTATASNVGAMRYTTDGSGSFADMCMEVAPNTYEWVNIVTNTFN